MEFAISPVFYLTAIKFLSNDLYIWISLISYNNHNAKLGECSELAVVLKLYHRFLLL
jgi:hypothetical protein